MHINEIVNLSSRDEDTSKFAIHFNQKSKKILMPNDMFLRIEADNIHLYLGVFDNSDIIAFVGLHKEGEHYQVDITSTLPKFRGQGFIRHCLEYAIHNFGPIISDWQQTPDAREVWSALIRRPNTVEYYYYNLQSQTKERIKWDTQTNKPVPDPWEEDVSYIVILATKKHLNEFSIKQRLARIEWNRANGRRDPWLGEGFTEFNP